MKAEEVETKLNLHRLTMLKDEPFYYVDEGNTFCLSMES